MILINGKESNLQMHQFATLEEMLAATYDDCVQAQQIITDVLLNDEPFSEIYPHQAEDISASQVNKLEIISMDIYLMASAMTEELFKVTKSMEMAATQSAAYFRQGDDAQGLELLQDLIDVNRDFLNVFGTLRTNFDVPNDENLTNTSETYSALLSELIDVMESEDWILLADLLEFEISPACLEWDDCLNFIRLHFASIETGHTPQ